MDIEFSETSKESFKYSIIYALNTDVLEINSKINDELMFSYINEVLKKDLKGLRLEDVLLNIIIVKLSKVPALFNKYAYPVINLKHDEYINKVKKIIPSRLTYKYAIDNLEIIDYQNQIEEKIMASYANSILSSKMEHLSEQKWFVKYIIHAKASENNFKPPVVGYSFSYYLKKRSKCFNFCLNKNNDYFIYRNYPTLDNYNNTIYINLGLFKVIKDSRGFQAGLLYLLNSAFKALSLAITRNKDFSITYDDEMYRFIKEEIIYKEDSNFYKSNESYFDTNIESSINSHNMINELLSNPLFNNLNIEKYNEIETIQYKNSKKYYNVDYYIDNILIKNPGLIVDYPMLSMEYDKFGKRKSIEELIKLKYEKLAIFNEQIINFKDIIKSNESLKDNISVKLKKLEDGIPGVIRCHNKMIYKAVKELDIKGFKAVLKTLNNIMINDTLEAIIQEKRTFIQKLQNNRKRIFKPSTFLNNDEFLSKEYITSCTFESIINEYKSRK
ncbi:MAG: hypothetical protein RR832_04645 [Bacilli bacterium]